MYKNNKIIKNTKNYEKYKKKNEYYKRIICGNCGMKGHIYKYCKEPIISLGIIVFRIINKKPEFLMIQRRNSVNYIEFIRGKYSLKDLEGIKNLFIDMTEIERNNIKEKSFEILWQELWSNPNYKSFKQEYNESLEKFNILKGYSLFIDKQKIEVSINYILKNTKIIWNKEPEWGFPKGRRNLGESDLHCAQENLQKKQILVKKIIFCSKI